MAKLLHRLVQDTLVAQPSGARMSEGVLARFEELLAIDSSVLRLHDLLCPTFAGCRTNHTKAAAKLHVVMNVLDGSPRRVKLTSERTSDGTPWRRVGQWVRGRLMLFDLGYYCFHLFDRIDANGGFFVSRAKSNFNPLIVGAHRKWRGRAVEVVGRRLQDVLPLLQRDFLDVEVEVEFKKRVYMGRRSTKRRTFRLVAVRNHETGEYHAYITNVPPDRLPAEDIAQTYALRWQVEILFKAMKSHGHLDQLPSTKRCVVECLVWASVLATLVSQALYREVRKAVDPSRHMPILRWATIVSRCATELLLHVAHRARPVTDQLLWRHLLREAPDPNINRKDRAIRTVPVLAGG
jgi:IS4 transposase